MTGRPTYEVYLEDVKTKVHRIGNVTSTNPNKIYGFDTHEVYMGRGKGSLKDFYRTW